MNSECAHTSGHALPVGRPVGEYSADQLQQVAAWVLTDGIGRAVAELIGPHTRNVAHYEPWLTLFGLRIVFERNR